MKGERPRIAENDIKMNEASTIRSPCAILTKRITPNESESPIANRT